MKKKLIKKVFKFLRSKSFRIGGIAFAALIILIAAYAQIPLPNIEDGYLPGDVRKVSHNAPLTIHFSQPMDRQSVEEYFSIQPRIAGSFNWVDSKTLEYQPDTPLEIGDDYQVMIGSASKSLYQKKLGIDTQLRFVVTGPPYVKFISPYLEPIEAPIDEGVEEVEEVVGFVEGVPITPSTELLIIPPDQKITVMFDRPLRALATLDDSAAYQDFPELEITPPIDGTYRWIGTTAFQFIPDEWVMGTVYTLKLPKGIPALDGGETEEEVVWKLATEAPKIIRTIPIEGDDVFLVEGEIVLQFNQEMELDFIRPGDNVRLYPSNDVDADKVERMDGFFNTEVVYGEDEEGDKDKSILKFKPEFPYQFDQEYKLAVLGGLLGGSSQLGGQYGGRAMQEDFILTFKTLSYPGIENFEPKNGNKNYGERHIFIEFASPMTKELVLEYADLTPAPEKEPTVYLQRDNRFAKIVYNFEPSKYYDFTFKAPFKDAAGNTADKGFKTSFKTAPRNPYVQLLTGYRSVGFFMEGLDPVYSVKTINVNTINAQLCSVGESEFLKVSHEYRWYNYRCKNPSKKAVTVNSKLNESHTVHLNLKDLFDKELGQGIYFFEVSSPEYVDSKGRPMRFYQAFFISDTALTLKKSDQDLLVWATDLKTGQPVSRMEIRVLSRKGKELQRGVTDGDGVYKIIKDFDESVYVVGRKILEGEDRWSLAGQYWNRGIESWRFQLSGQWVGYDEPRIYLFTERPLYRPGDELFFKGLYRMDRDADLAFPDDRKVRVVLEDSEYNKVQSDEFFLLPDGSFNGSFTLTDKARLGRYNLYAETIDRDYSKRFYHYFFVEEYKKPKFKVELLSKTADTILGEELSVDIQANYYFGGAIQGGEARWTLQREPYWFNRYKGEGYYAFGSFSGFRCFWYDCHSVSKVVLQGEGELDQSGRLNLTLPTDQESDPGQSYLYTLNVEVENKDGEFVANRESFMVHQGPFYIGLQSKSYLVKAGDRFETKVITVTPEGEILPGKRVTLELYREEWNTVKKQGVDGAFYDESVRELIYVKKRNVTTSEEPVTVPIPIDATMEGGRYIIHAKGADNVFTETSFYVTSSSWVNWGSSNNNRMELVSDQPEYFVGGKARVMIKSPYGSEEKPAKALVTYERGSIQHYEVIDITSNTDTLEIPIIKEMMPNVYVSVMVVRDSGDSLDQFLMYQDWDLLKSKESRLGFKIKALKKEIKTLSESKDKKMANRNAILISKNKVKLTPLREDLEEVQTSLESYADQKPEATSFDLVKPDFKLGIVNLPVNKREKEILIDLKTSQTHYQVGDKVEIEIHTRDFQNRPIPAVVSLAVVDASLLALKANTKVSPMDYFYGRRALQVSTATNLTVHADRVDVESEKGAKGGGGAGVDETFDKKRGEFKDTAYFDPLIQTDEGGYAKVEFEPPDNLTTWEMWAVASSAEDRFGMAKEDFVVRKPVALTSVLPRFVISEDRLEIGALVHNQSGEDVETKVTLKAEGLSIKGGHKKSVFVRDGASERVKWDVTVNPVSADSVLSIEFRSQHDTASYPLPVKTFAFPEVVATNGTVENIHTEKVRIPANVAPNMGELAVRVGGSLATKFIKQFKALQDYPYGCAEQITSQILPLLVVQLKSLENEEVDLFELMGLDAEKSRDIIDDTLQKLFKFQRFDGGYGFWEGSDYSYPMLTSYILYGQHLGREAGFTVSDNNFKLAIQYLWKKLRTLSSTTYPRLTDNDRAFVLWVLSEVSEYDTGMTLNLFEDREGLSLYARALMLMNLKNLYDAGQRSVRPYIERLKSEIVSEQIVNDRLIHFEEEEVSFWDLNTNRRTTAMVLMALNRENPDNPILPNVVHFLSTSTTKKKHHFLNPQETAWTLLSMLEYANAHDVLSATFDFDVKVNLSKILSGEITSENLSEVFSASIPLSEMNIGDDLNEINFKKDGKGQMIFDMEYKYYLPNEVILPLEKGLNITREYFEFETDNEAPVRTMKSGEIYRGELNIIVPEDMYYVVVDERLPAGLEAINFNLETTDTSLQERLEEEIRPEDEEKTGYRYWYSNPIWRFNHKEMRDDRVLLFADRLPKGVYTYSFLVRAGLPGQYHHLPASAYQMYFPEVFGRTGGEMLEVKD